MKEQSIINSEPSKPFRIIARSSNTNSFGLRQFVLVARNGEAWRVCRADSCPAVTWEAGATILVPCTEAGELLWARQCVELPERLAKCPRKALREIFGK